MRTALAVATVVFFAIPVVAQTIEVPASGQPYTLRPESQSSNAGSSYEVTRFDNPNGTTDWQVRLLDTNNVLKADVHINENAQNVQTVTVKQPNKPPLIVTWDRGRQQMRLTLRGRTGIATPDRDKGKWREDATFARIKADHTDAVLMAGAVLDDVVSIPRMKARKPASSSTEAPDGEAASRAPESHDGFAAADVCGTLCQELEFANSRHYCCAQARVATNLCCWNQWCTGCYCWSPGNWCTSSCIAVDYFCFCTATGRACAGPA